MKLLKSANSLRAHLIAAAMIYVVDAFFFGQGAFAVLVAAGFLLSGVARFGSNLINRRPLFGAYVAKVGIYTLMSLAVFTTIKIDNEIAQKRADRIVLAIKKYKARYGRYPDRLEALVPDFLPLVPKAKYTFTFNYFYYRNITSLKSADFSYFAIPPFGRPTYNFEKNKWIYIIRDQASKQGIPYFSLKDELCTAEGCRVRTGDHLESDLMEFDYGHLSHQGSVYVVQNGLGAKIKALLSITKKSLR